MSHTIVWQMLIVLLCRFRFNGTGRHGKASMNLSLEIQDEKTDGPVFGFGPKSRLLRVFQIAKVSCSDTRVTKSATVLELRNQWPVVAIPVWWITEEFLIKPLCVCGTLNFQNVPHWNFTNDLMTEHIIWKKKTHL